MTRFLIFTCICLYIENYFYFIVFRTSVKRNRAFFIEIALYRCHLLLLLLLLLLLTSPQSIVILTLSLPSPSWHL